MSDIDVSSEGGGHKQGRGVKKAKKLSTRVDMTPMVDLGFLLITFFIFTATLSTPTTMGLIMPKDEKDPKDLTEVKQSGALTVMLGKGNQVYYYLGELKTDGSNFLSTNFKDIRKIIQDKKKEVRSRHVHDAGCEKIWAKNEGDKTSCEDKDFVVVIKPN
ncbi:MAG: biopolymer transporter ExbD, partial [Bacteroidota bacterium]